MQDLYHQQSYVDVRGGNFMLVSTYLVGFEDSESWTWPGSDVRAQDMQRLRA